MAIRIRILQIAEDIRESYWFLPGLMALGGLAAGLVLVLVDARVGDGWLGRFEWFYGSRPEGARSVLSTIASSTITVAGVVFSITLAAVTYASGQYGPRLLTNFQRDRGNQATLGTFIATFLYCLVVLRTIRSAEEASADTAGALREAFVPQLALYGALALAIASIVVLVYFVHHVTDGIHINTAVARIGEDLIRDVRRRPIANGGEAADATPKLKEPVSVAARATGYIEAVDSQALVALASRHDLVVRLRYRAGDFVHAGRPLIDASPASRVDPHVARGLTAAVALGRRRTPLQDLRFAIDELVEIAARALSPGINDPFTAIACIDWLGAALSELETRCAEEEVLADEHGNPRLIVQALRFEDFLASAFGQFRPYVLRDPNARASALQTLGTVAAGARDPAHRAQLLTERERLAND